MRLLPPASRLFRTLSGDGWLLFATRGARMFAYGFLSVVLLLYLKSEGLSEERIGFLLTMTLLGDVVISLWITTAADRIGRKWMLILGACLMAMVGVVFALTANFRGNAVSTEDGTSAVRHFGEFFHENGAQFTKLFHHVFVVDNLLADINGTTIEIQRDLDNIDSPHDAGTKSPRFEKIDLLVSARIRSDWFERHIYVRIDYQL